MFSNKVINQKRLRRVNFDQLVQESKHGKCIDIFLMTADIKQNYYNNHYYYYCYYACLHREKYKVIIQ